MDLIVEVIRYGDIFFKEMGEKWIFLILVISEWV